jgi:uncharacterized RDD family membrane protein YckC
MEIYVWKDGARRGPYLPFKIRELLEEKEILPSDSGWMEGMEAWAPLSSIEAISQWIPRDPALPPPLPPAEELERRTTVTQETATPQPEVEARRVRAWLRWAARTIDEVLWFTLIWISGVLAGHLNLWDYVFRHPILLFGPALLWIPVEALLLSRIGTTPGKWMLGIRVTDDLGQNLAYWPALKRSSLVLVIGNGFGMPTFELLPMIQGVMSWILYRRSGNTLWDRAAQSQLVHSKPPAPGMILTGALFIGWIILGTWITFTVPLPPDFPEQQRERVLEMRQEFEQNLQQMRTSSKRASGPEA